MDKPAFEIKKAAFVTSMASYAPPPEADWAQIALAGKSNVGKSSLINSLCRNKKLARTSSDPGKTRLLNFYALNEAFYLVDLPGYGFARAPKHEKEAWAVRIEGYLTGTQQLKHIIHLVDIRHDPTADDVQMMQWLRATGMPFSVVATKADKISRGARMRHIAAICRSLVVQPWEVIAYSSEDGTGRDALLKLIDEKILSPEDEPGLE